MTMKKLSILLSTTLFITLIALITCWFFPKQKPEKNKLTLQPSSFEQLPGWKATSPKQSLVAFQSSCRTFLKQDSNKSVGTTLIPLTIADWQPACRAANAVKPLTASSARTFFETWFTPAVYTKKHPVEGLFTGYFLPLLQGSAVKTSTASVPLYGMPSNIIRANLGLFDPKLNPQRIAGRVNKKMLIPFYTREAINNGAIHHKAPVLAWLKSPIDRQFLEIEGSGAVEFPNGKRVYIGYAGENGHPYTSIASVLIKEGTLTRDNASTTHIKHYLESHPSEMNRVLNKNKAFVFFRKLPGAAVGAQGVPLTPGYSLAIDRQWIPYGTPLWLDTTTTEKDQKKTPFQRLMVAQDTGGAIRGVVRGDVFWGAGEQAKFMAAHMQEKGRYWILIPRQTQRG